MVVEEDKLIQGIVGGTAISTRVLEDNILIEDLYDTYMRYPGAKPAVELKPKAAFHNGFTEEIDIERKLELIKNDIWTELFGYSVILFQDGNIQAVNPRVNRVGFIYTATNDLGEPIQIGIRWNPDEQFQGPDILVERAPFSLKGSGDLNGFYPFRSLPGLPGARGLSCLLPLIDVIRAQHKIFIEYTKYAEHQGLAHPVVKIENLTDTARTQVRGQLTAPRKDKAVIIDMKDDFYYESPQQGAYDPAFMMQFADQYIVRESAITMSMLTGDPMGYLSASQTTINEWFSAIKEYQDHKLPQYLPILLAIGMSKDVKFQDPSEPTLEAKLESVKFIREGLEGLVSRESLLKYINNEILGLEGDEELELASEEEAMMYNNQPGDDSTENDRDQQKQ
jgi:hypothetical protein